ncbi:MAG: Hsp70 family protein [Anaerolineae bacterium]|nr:Hsp70 family protein [Anaerolineae bacterium]
MSQPQRVAIDFGTTNSVIARWRGDDSAGTTTDASDASDVLTLPGLSQPDDPPLIPSLLYVQNGQDRQHAQTVGGQAVRENGLDRRGDNRLFRNFKRGLVAAPAPPPRLIDGQPWADRDAGGFFLRHLLDGVAAELPDGLDGIEQVVLTAPVASFEGYVAWLSGVVDGNGLGSRVRVVDEATAAALGYAVTEPGLPVLVFDFGGGTLDLALVQLPEQTGGFLHRLRGKRQETARVIAKAGRILGGSDIDQWLLAEVLRRTGLTPETLGPDYTPLLTRCEAAKIALSTAESVPLDFTAAGQDHHLTITRANLEALLETNGFFAAVRHVVDKVMHVARQEGIFKEDIAHVLMVGGTSLMPSVQAALGAYFSGMAICADKPFTAVVEGALHVAAGGGLDDYVLHGYGIRCLDDAGTGHFYDELVPMGTRYPTGDPFEIILQAAHPDQDAVEFVIGEIATDSVALVEVRYEDGQAVFVARADQDQQQIVPLNAGSAPLARLKPPGSPGQDRLKAAFSIDEQRHLRLTVTDLRTRKTLLKDAAVVTLR